MTYPTRNTGADLIPFAPQPSYPGPRRQAIKAMRNAQARREREDAQRPYDADRLARNLAERPPDVRVNDGDGDEATREYLRRMGWTDERLAAAQESLRDDLQGRVHPITGLRPSLTAGGGQDRGPGPSQPRPPSAVAPGRTTRDLMGMVRNINAARDAGLDPAKLWPGQAGLPGRPSTRGLLASAGPDRPIPALVPPVSASFDLLTDSTTSGPNRRAPGGRAPRRTGGR
jgi:hypothetical protein